MASWYVYVLRTRAGHLYTGIATDVARRIEEHESENGRGAKALRGRGPLRLVYRRRVGDLGLALRVEKRLKRESKRDKEAIVSAGPTRKALLEQFGFDPEPPRRRPRSKA